MSEKICVVATTNAPAQQVLDFVNYHLNIGVDHVFLFFDSELKKNYNGLIKLKDVTCFFRPRNRSEKIEDVQRRNANHALEVARKKRFDWISHLDADELIYLTRYGAGLKSFLSRISRHVDYIRLPTIEATPEKLEYEHPLREVNLFKHNFWKLSKLFFRGHISGKSIVRVGPRIESLGIHLPEPHKKLRVKFIVFGARLMHFNRCSYLTWKRSFIPLMSKNCKSHEGNATLISIINEFEKCYENGDEEQLMRLYKRQFFVSERIKRLFLLLGIMERIKIDGRMFSRRMI